MTVFPKFWKPGYKGPFRYLSRSTGKFFCMWQRDTLYPRVFFNQISRDVFSHITSPLNKTSFSLLDIHVYVFLLHYKNKNIKEESEQMSCQLQNERTLAFSFWWLVSDFECLKAVLGDSFLHHYRDRTNLN